MRCLVVLFLLIFSLRSSASAGIGSAPLFPTVQGRDLNGQVVTLPAAIDGPVLVVIGFSHAAGEPCKLWQQHFCGSGLSATACPVLEVVELESAPFFVPPLVARGLKQQVPTGLYGRVVILRQSKKVLQMALGFDPIAGDDPYLALLDVKGYIAWYGHGPWSQGRQDALQEALDLLAQGMAIPLRSRTLP
jgi:hypothetical protein